MIERSDLLKNKREICSPPHTIHKRKQSQGMINVLNNIDCVPSNVQFSHQETLLYVFEDNEAVIKMIIKGKESHNETCFPEPTELLLIGYSIESIWTQKSKSNNMDTKNQLADMLTKGNVTRDEWNHLLCLFNISHSSSTDCSEVMSKRVQEDSGEE